MKRVIVIEPNDRFDIEPAAEHGEVVYLREGGYNWMQPTGTLNELCADLERIQFDPANDVICMTGHPVVLALFTVAVASMCDEVSVLLYDTKLRPRPAYRAKTLAFHTEEVRDGVDS